MKKLLSVFAIIAMMIGFTACGNSNSSKKQLDPVGEVSGVTFSASEEPVKVDAEAEGFGRCSVSGCHCKEFEGRGQTCKNCGHAYSKHY